MGIVLKKLWKEVNLDEVNIAIIGTRPIITSSSGSVSFEELDMGISLLTCKSVKVFFASLPRYGRRVDLIVIELVSKDLREIKDFLSCSEQRLPYRVPILVLSDLDEQVYSPRCFEAGVAGFLGKDARCQEIFEAMVTLLAGGSYGNREHIP